MQGIEPPYTDPYVRWCERSTSQLMASLLLDCARHGRQLDGESPLRVFYSRKRYRKVYRRLSQTYKINKAITTKRLYKWGLKSLITIAESTYARY